MSAALRVRLAAWLIGLIAAGSGFATPAAAVSAAPPALLGWLRATTAIPKASKDDDNSSVSGLPALNGNLTRSFNRLRNSGPDWLDRINVGVNLQEDLSAAYRIGAVQPLQTHLDGAAVEARTWLAWDALGNRSGHLGIGYNGRLQDGRFAGSLFSRAEENRGNDLWRYVFGGSIGWAGLQLQANLINKVAREISGGEQRFKRSVDSYSVGVNTDLPALPWARVGARKFWNAAPRSAGRDVDGYSLRLWLQPIRPLVFETGTDDTNHKEPDWFACLRIQLKFD